MLDRYVGIAGLVIGILAFIAPYRWPSMPPIITTIGLGIAVGLIGMASRHIHRPEFSDQSKSSVSSVGLFLQFSDDHTVPTEIKQVNVRSWYALFTESIYVKTLDENQKETGGFSVPPRWSVFLLFKAPATYRQMLAKCVGPGNPKCAVQVSNDRYAIVAVTGDVTKSTVEITTLLSPPLLVWPALTRLRRPRIDERDDIVHRPKVIRDASGHRR